MGASRRPPEDFLTAAPVFAAARFQEHPDDRMSVRLWGTPSANREVPGNRQEVLFHKDIAVEQRREFLEGFTRQLADAISPHLEVPYAVRLRLHVLGRGLPQGGPGETLTMVLLPREVPSPAATAVMSVLAPGMTPTSMAAQCLDSIRARLHDPLVLVFHARVSDDFIRQKALHEGLQVLRKMLEL